MPMTTWSTPLPDSDASVRMPASFRPSSTRSLGHLIRTGAPVMRWMAMAAETAAMGVRGSRSSGVPSGRHSTERYRPSPSGDSKLRPMRPRPAVCRRAITAVPLGAPWAARLLHTVLVESTVS